MPVDGDLGLDQLLARGVDVSGVSEGEVAAQLLLDDDAGGGVAQGAQVVGVHFDAPGPKELLHAAADGGVQGAAEQGVGGGVGAGLFLLLRVQALLALGAPQRQQGHHVGLGQRRIASIGDSWPFQRSVHAQGDVVILHAGGGVQVDGGLNADRVGEVDVSALQLVAGSGDDRISLGDGDAAQQRRRGYGAAQAQVHVAGQLGVGVLEVQLRRGDHMHIQPDVVGRGVGGRDGLHGVGLRHQGGNVEAGADRKAGDEHVARELQVVLRSLQVHRGVGQGAYPLGIANANSFAGGRKVCIDSMLVGEVAGYAQLSAAAHGG